MGGRALSVVSARITAKNYKRLVKELLPKIHTICPEADVVVSYKEKPDFGDMDILVYPGFDQEKIAETIGAIEYKRNGDVTSYGICLKEGLFQIDLIRVPTESFNFARNYFSNNDYGNLLGRIAHKAGFKLGHLGLFYIIRDPSNSDHIIQEIVVSREWQKSLEPFGYKQDSTDPPEFTMLTDMFRMVASSPYFNSDIFKLENRNHISRVRDKKRVSYQTFLKWCDENDDTLTKFNWNDKAASHRDFFERVSKIFPNLAEEYDATTERYALHKMVTSKFNGDVVKEITGLSGKELGKFITEFKKLMPDFTSWVLESSPTDINKKIREVSNLL